jgi:hypothetical protein
LHKKYTAARGKTTKSRINSVFKIRVSKRQFFYLLAYLCFIGFGGTVTNPFLYNKPIGFTASFFLTKIYYQLAQFLFIPEQYTTPLILQQNMNIQVSFDFKKNFNLLVREKWNMLKLFNIPINQK